LTLSLHLHHCQGGPPPVKSVIPTGPGFPATHRRTSRVCGFRYGKQHEVRQRHQPRQEIRGSSGRDDKFNGWRPTLAVVEAEGQNQHNSNQPGFGLPAFSSTHSASCAVHKAVRPTSAGRCVYNWPSQMRANAGRLSTDYCCTATEEELAPHPQSNKAAGGGLR
jgi:hypothetical protein